MGEVAGINTDPVSGAVGSPKRAPLSVLADAPESEKDGLLAVGRLVETVKGIEPSKGIVV